MAQRITLDRSKAHNPKNRRKRNRTELHKPNGVLSQRVRSAGADRFAFVCIDPAKARSEWMMADFLGNILIEPRTLTHSRGQLKAAVELVRQTVRQRDIRDVIVTVERSGNLQRPTQQAFRQAGFETRIVHPFAVKQYRQPASPGIKTDRDDLIAQHRAAAAGFGLIEQPLEDNARRLRLLIRHRRDLVQKASALCCQIREHLELVLPGYAACFSDLWQSSLALPLARRCNSPRTLNEYGLDGVRQLLRDEGIRAQTRSLGRLLAWADQAVEPSPDAELHRQIWIDLEDDRRAKRRQIHEAEARIVECLVHTPYVLLLAIPALNVVSVADLAGEMGPITHYANANAITGRAGLFPSRYQSDQTDYADGPLVRSGNRRLRAALMRIADNLVKLNHYFRGKAELARSRRTAEKLIRVRTAKNFSRLGFAIVAGQQVLRHPCCQPRESILLKLIRFHHQHGLPAETLQAHLAAATHWLPDNARHHEAGTLSQQLTNITRRRGPSHLAELLPALVDRLTARPTPKTSGEVPD